MSCIHCMLYLYFTQIKAKMVLKWYKSCRILLEKNTCWNNHKQHWYPQIIASIVSFLICILHKLLLKANGLVLKKIGQMQVKQNLLNQPWKLIVWKINSNAEQSDACNNQVKTHQFPIWRKLLYFTLKIHNWF